MMQSKERLYKLQRWIARAEGMEELTEIEMEVEAMLGEMPEQFLADLRRMIEERKHDLNFNY